MSESRGQRRLRIEAFVLEVLKRERRELKSSEVAMLAGRPLQTVGPALRRLAAKHVVRVRNVDEVDARSRVVTYKMFRWVGECQLWPLLQPMPRELPPGVARVVRGRDTRG